MKKRIRRSEAKTATMISSKIVKPCFFIFIIIAQRVSGTKNGSTDWDRTSDLGLMSPTL